ncbi:LOW QUALITY PROTEIN: upper zone of growth plate and cartilage matrix associated a [Xiphophorus hellerii]|uniref:LOW QUALITY PROTEIN: upper zone of growth plate and cartilage matrix associated a n=1 Tax=Xiphophorus hellerii TaxID=8084 RepID=UPI0013B45DA0|nr:LOW QUALITY PROTEIN: unique cartilage matrix-associated protein [Xiphophorus hellerii]
MEKPSAFLHWMNLSLPSLHLLPLFSSLPGSPTVLPSIRPSLHPASVLLDVLFSPTLIWLLSLRMSWTRAFLLSSLSVLLIVTFSGVVKSAAVRDDSKPADAQGAARQVFMAESDASNFFSQKRRSRRSPKYYAEVQAEQRMKRAASERRREYNEEQRDEYENYLEEDRDEVNERSRETNEQLREYHYDGLHPRFYWFH